MVTSHKVFLEIKNVSDNQKAKAAMQNFEPLHKDTIFLQGPWRKTIVLFSNIFKYRKKY
jgi:hypothetical protein